MTAIKESGHAKMVSNFRTLINIIKILGTKYNPNNTTIQLTQLENLLNNAEAQLENLMIANSNYKQKVVIKNQVFKNLNKLFTSIINALQSSGVDAKTLENAKYYNRKIQGRRASNKSIESTDINTSSSKTISTSQRSASQQIQHLSGLIALLEIEPNYNPNEPELQIINLQAKKNALLAALDDIDITYSNLNNQRIERNNILYKNNQSIYKSATEVKSYIKSVFGANSLEYKSISKLTFIKLIS